MYIHFVHTILYVYIFLCCRFVRFCFVRLAHKQSNLHTDTLVFIAIASLKRSFLLLLLLLLLLLPLQSMTNNKTEKQPKTRKSKQIESNSRTLKKKNKNKVQIAFYTKRTKITGKTECKLFSSISC